MLRTRAPSLTGAAIDCPFGETYPTKVLPGSYIDIADDTQEMYALGSSNTVFEQVHNLSGSTCNMHCSVVMITNAMFWLDMATSQGLFVSGRQLK